MRKAERHKIIKQIIIENEIETQDELLNYLKAEDISLTQATISRDLRELNIVRSYTKEGKKKFTLIASEQSEQDFYTKFRKSINDYSTVIEQVNFLVIIHTLPHGADVIANYMDEIDFEQVAATVAGYDTLIIVTRAEESAKQLIGELNKCVEI
ncbi:MULTISPECIES: arginine repressor [Enterococcus]|uniref:Arginine repressor n=1 Tax=Candidatus Enterococcus ferrettii TaxID=2815324 RepID=A0ABV0EU80_9ENTE|nr:ArgR family transcriptional regulator [Enterococcus sp. 665A]MBO1339497.1 ArgR family transcriptional regulator [Enterococcus sp. 665A]